MGEAPGLLDDEDDGLGAAVGVEVARIWVREARRVRLGRATSGFGQVCSWRSPLRQSSCRRPGWLVVDGAAVGSGPRRGSLPSRGLRCPGRTRGGRPGVGTGARGRGAATSDLIERVILVPAMAEGIFTGRGGGSRRPPPVPSLTTWNPSRTATASASSSLIAMAYPQKGSSAACSMASVKPSGWAASHLE